MSFIDGTLRSTIPGANLYLLNPACVLFGGTRPIGRAGVGPRQHGGLSAPQRRGRGSQGLGTPANSVLTVAPVEAFGFLGGTPGRITVQGAFLQVPDAQTLSLIGGDVALTNATLYAPAGRINVAAVASAGEVIPTDTDLTLQGFGGSGTSDSKTRSDGRAADGGPGLKSRGVKCRWPISTPAVKAAGRFSFGRRAVVQPRWLGIRRYLWWPERTRN